MIYKNVVALCKEKNISIRRLERETKLLRKQMELLAEQSEDYDASRLRAAYEQLKDYSRKELIAIRRALNEWQWPEVLGDPPVDNWDALPHYRRPDMPKGTMTKVDYVKPYMDACLVLGVSHWDMLK